MLRQIEKNLQDDWFFKVTPIILTTQEKSTKKGHNQTFAFDGSMVASLANRERIINKVD